MGKLTFGQKKTAAQKVAMATSRGYDSGKKSAGSKPAPSAKISLKGTNPIKGKVAVAVKGKF